MLDLGIPFTRIYDPDRRRGRWVYRDVLHENDRLLVVTGDAGVGKTLWTVNLLLALATGSPFMGVEPEPESTLPVCLYVDLDMGEDLVMDRFEQVGRGMGLTADTLEPRLAVVADTWSLGSIFEDGWQKLGELLYKSQARWAVLESFLDLCGATLDPNNNSQVNHIVQRLLTKWPGINWIVVHHEGKSKWTPGGDVKAVQHRGIGAQALMKNATRNVSISRVNGVAGEEVRVVEHGKVRTGSQPKPYRYRMDGTPELVRLIRIEGGL